MNNGYDEKRRRFLDISKKGERKSTLNRIPFFKITSMIETKMKCINVSSYVEVLYSTLCTGKSDADREEHLLYYLLNCILYRKLKNARRVISILV